MESALAQAEVRLRALEPDDVDKLYIWENNPALWQFGNVKAPMSRHQLWEYAQNYNADPFAAGQLRLIIELQPQIACGIVDLYDVDAINSRAMVGIMVSLKYRRQKIASRALALLEDYCHNTLNLHGLAADVAIDNEPSIALFKSAGYTCCGQKPDWYRRNRRYISAMTFHKLL